MRHVGDKVAADLIGPPQVGDVVQHEDDAVLRRPGRRSRARRDRARRVARRRELQRLRLVAEQHFGHQIRDGGDADRFGVLPANRHIPELQHQLGRVVHQLQSALCVDHDDAFHHAREDGFRSRAIARLFGKPASDLLDGLIESTSDGP